MPVIEAAVTFAGEVIEESTLGWDFDPDWVGDGKFVHIDSFDNRWEAFDGLDSLVLTCDGVVVAQLSDSISPVTDVTEIVEKIIEG